MVTARCGSTASPATTCGGDGRRPRSMRTCCGRDSRWHGNTPPRGEAGRGAACWREGRRLLAESEARQTGMGRLRVLGAEGLTAFKLQALVNEIGRAHV